MKRLGFVLLLTGTAILGSATADDARVETDMPEHFLRLEGNFHPCGPTATAEELTSPDYLKYEGKMDAAPLPELRNRFRPPSARDLPGIVKMERETDTEDFDVASSHCSATRISENWFLTAAHCLTGSFDRIVLRANSQQLSSNEIQRVEVDFAVCHGSFSGQTDNYRNDIALVHVADDDIDRLVNVPPVAWGQTSRPFSEKFYETARVGGWGALSYYGELADMLQREEIHIIDVLPDRIRGATQVSGGPCVGDSGGPLMVDDESGHPVMMGVLSTLMPSVSGEMCSGVYAVNYVNLETQRDWINAVMETCELDDALCRRSLSY